MNIKEIAYKRFTTKKYKPDQIIPQDIIEQLIDLLHFSPSSINSQPFHFIVAATTPSKERIAKSMAEEQFLYNQGKILDASHTIVICSKTDMTKDHIVAVLDQEEKEGRINSSEKKKQTIDSYMNYVNAHRYRLKDVKFWMEKQCYIALGGLLLGAAALGIDSTPIEGFNNHILDQEFNLHEQGYTSVLLVPLGYHAEDDYNATLPKSRLPKEKIFTFI